jgi:hypothetical protein
MCYLGSRFILTHSVHNCGNLQISIFVIFRNTRHHTQATSHLARLYAVPFFGHEKNRQQRSWADDLVGQCLLCRLYFRKTFSARALGLPTNLVFLRSWLFPASSVTFLTRSLNSRRVIFSRTCRWQYPTVECC